MLTPNKELAQFFCTSSEYYLSSDLYLSSSTPAEQHCASNYGNNSLDLQKIALFKSPV